MKANKHNKLRNLPQRFFPFELLLGLIKYNLISLMYWAILFAIVSDNIGSAFGIPILFYSPEYLGEVSYFSFLLLGIALGGFIMAFQTYSFIKLGPRYSFLSLVSMPFVKFSLNNFILPSLFVLYYLFKMIQFQLVEESASVLQILVYSLSVIFGIIAFITFSFMFFFSKKRKHDVSTDETIENPVQSLGRNKIEWYNYFRSEKHRTYYFIDGLFKISKSRNTHHIDKSAIEKIYSKNRINAFLFETLALISFFAIGFLKDFRYFEFPASVSIVLLLTILHMIFSALMSWFHRWSYPIIFGTIIGMNYLSIHTNLFNYRNYAYGLNYTRKNKIVYDNKTIQSFYLKQDLITQSKKNCEEILGNWKNKTHQNKPKLILVCSSGGGSRSALWTLSVLQECNKEIGANFNKQLHLMTGASGGMIGAAFYRQLLISDPKNISSSIYKQQIAKDLLNKLSFSASTHDMFIRLNKLKYNNMNYVADRGSAFERQLHLNTNHLLEHPLSYYVEPEKKADVPIIALTPTIANDGRRLLLSAQSFALINNGIEHPFTNSFENIDYQTFFKSIKPNDLRFSSALRMSATFPFIMPMTTLPTDPEMQIMDAGIRDNYGIKFTMAYVYAMKDWIKENTSGVIILQIRDTKKNLSNVTYHKISLLNKMTIPFGNMYKNFPRTQDFDQEQLLEMSHETLPFPIYEVSFNLRENYKNRISLSWHLTKKEKEKIQKALYTEGNQKALSDLRSLIAKK